MEDNNDARKLGSKTSPYAYAQSRSDVLDVVYDDADFPTNNVYYKEESEFSKTQNIIGKLKNYRNRVKWRRVGQQIDRQFDAILSLASTAGVQVNNLLLFLKKKLLYFIC